MNVWLVFIACFAATAFVAVTAAGLHGLGYQIGTESEEDDR